MSFVTFFRVDQMNILGALVRCHFSVIISYDVFFKRDCVTVFVLFLPLILLLSLLLLLFLLLSLLLWLSLVVIVDYRVCIDSKDSKRYTDTYFCKHCRLFISFGQYLYIILLLTGYVEKDGSISTSELWISLEV